MDFSKLHRLATGLELQNLVAEIQLKGAFVAEYNAENIVIENQTYAHKRVIVFGSLHTQYDQGIPFKMIRKAIAELPKEAVVLYEGEAILTQLLLGKQNSQTAYFNSIKAVYEPTLWQKIKQKFFPTCATEMGLSLYLATNKNLDVENADLPYNAAFSLLKNHYSDEDILSYGINFRITQLGYQRINALQYKMIHADVKKKFGLSINLPIEGYNEYTTFKKADPMFLHVIYERDAYALAMLFEKLKTHDTVFIAFGGVHWHMWKDVLEQYLGTPKTYSYEEYLKS